MAVIAAALTVCVLPTACDYPLASPPGAPTAPVGGSVDDPTTAPVVVPVGNTTKAEPTRDRGDSTNTRTRTRTRTPRPTKPPVTTTVSTEPGTPPVVDPGTPPVVDPGTPPVVDPNAPPVDDTTTTAPPTAAPPTTIQPEELLGRTCGEGDNKGLAAHTGFQAEGAQCVSTQMGAVAANNQLPSLIITEAPATIEPGKSIFLKVSTRNLVRDRFLGAAAGGYYLEASFLNNKGLQRGHFHTACRMVSSSSTPPSEAPVAERSPFFLATQDGAGGSTPDSITIEVPGDKTAQTGIMQCASWAGDGSHRTPMMSFANQIPAFDSVRINIGGNAPALPDAPAAGAPAEAQADAQQQAEGQQQQAEQAPDQDGSGEPAGQVTAPAESATPAAESSAATESGTAKPAASTSSKSLDERFKELREEKGDG